MRFNEYDFLENIIRSNVSNFDELALNLFLFQYANNAIYAHFVKNIGLKKDEITAAEIPFLPVEFFKTQSIRTTDFKPEIIFTSSGTTGLISGKHEVKDISIYRRSFSKTFELFYGNISEYCLLALLPSYLEREGSSLVFMTEELIKRSAHPDSGFYLHDLKKLAVTLDKLKKNKQKTILLGVTFALLDFAEQYPVEFPELIIMETGGMKGRRKEIVREEVHSILKKSFSVQNIHSEYGMTELLSQAYSKGEGKFKCPPWMKVVITDPNDPMKKISAGKTGVINVIDLANIYSCAFIKTADLGRINPDETFEVIGRLDNTDLRGCNLMYL